MTVAEVGYPEVCGLSSQFMSNHRGANRVTGDQIPGFQMYQGHSAVSA